VAEAQDAAVAPHQVERHGGQREAHDLADQRQRVGRQMQRVAFGHDQRADGTPIATTRVSTAIAIHMRGEQRLAFRHG
jgi:hypothetical protein